MRIATVLGLFVLVLPGCGEDPPSPKVSGGVPGAEAGTRAGGQANKPNTWAQPLAIGPISYFNAQCVSCHGEYGVMIADHNIAKESTPQEYRGMVSYMVTERSGSSLPERELDAQTAYCISLARPGSAFVSVVNPVTDGALEGEVTPGSTVTLVMARGQVRINAKVDGHRWSIDPPTLRSAKSSAGGDWVQGVLEARSPQGVLTTLRLASGAFAGPPLRETQP